VNKGLAIDWKTGDQLLAKGFTMFRMVLEMNVSYSIGTKESFPGGKNRWREKPSSHLFLGLEFLKLCSVSIATGYGLDDQGEREFESR
jgi:hypothetical protein